MQNYHTWQAYQGHISNNICTLEIVPPFMLAFISVSLEIQAKANLRVNYHPRIVRPGNSMVSGDGIEKSCPIFQ